MSAASLDEFARHFRIPVRLLQDAGFRHGADYEVRELLGVHGRVGQDLAGVTFQYRDPRDGRVLGHRVCLDLPLPGGQKYLSEQGCRHLFFPPGVKNVLADVSVPVVVVEAEKSCLAIWALADRAGRPLLPIAIGGCWGWLRNVGKRLLPQGGSAQQPGPSPDFELIAWKDRLVILALDSNVRSNSDVRHARWRLAHELAARGARVLFADIPEERGVNGPDDLIAIAGDEPTLRMLDSARTFPECAHLEAECAIATFEANKKSDPAPVIEALANIEESQRREFLIGRIAALKIAGVSRRFIEQQVRLTRAAAEQERRDIAEAVRCSSLRALGVTVCIVELLDKIYAFVRRFVLLSEAQARVVALWILHTHVFSVTDYTPYLAITSPEKGSGKTRLLEVLSTLAANPWLTGKVSPAVLYRKIDAEHPTLLLDESDAAFNGAEEYAEALRGVLNTGYQRSGKASCCVGKGAEMSYHDFSTFCPKAIAGIGKLPDTIADRSVPIRLKRAARNECVERFRQRKVEPEAEALRNQLAAWSAAVLESIQTVRPELPETLTDRQQDGAEPLLAIAEVIGGEWPDLARRSFVELCAQARAADDSIGVRLLCDIRSVFTQQESDRVPSYDLAEALAKIETSPWGEWSRGKPITHAKLAQLLHNYDIRPHSIRFPDGRNLKGYETGDFEDAWSRYLPSEGPADSSPAADNCNSKRHTVTNRISTEDSCDFRNVTPGPCDSSGNAERPNKNGSRDVVTVSAPREGQEEEL